MCPDCGRASELRPTDAVRAGWMVDSCAVCRRDNLYIQKDFNRILGILVVAIGVGCSIVFFALNRPFVAMLALVATALVDAVIYLLLSEVTVCYACHAIYRGFRRNPDHAPFSLELLERYGGQSRRK